MADDLIAFVRARLDEDEALAKGPPGWKLEHWSAVRYKTSDSGRNWRVDAEPRCIVDAVAKEDGEHIARHDPARVLREVEAMRDILTAYIKTEAGGYRGDGWIAFRFTVETLAMVWGEHPEYRQEWAL